VELTDARIERGEYLANHVMMCTSCHSVREENTFAQPPKAAYLAAGGTAFDQAKGFPGAYYAMNITPAGIKDWTDGELFRAISAGVDKNGEALFPIMPYLSYGRLPKEDIYAVIAYLRSLDPIDNEVPESSRDFPMSIIINMIPQKGAHDLKPDPSNPVKHGEYLVTAAVCGDCHTPMGKNGQPDENMKFAGGLAFELPTGGVVRSTNITPAEETGIGSWSEEAFVARFKAYENPEMWEVKVADNSFNSEMPWLQYAQMKEEDLKAIYAYLQSLKPIENEVETFTASN
jgi:mono/diheme cytochrome c family protein